MRVFLLWGVGYGRLGRSNLCRWNEADPMYDFLFVLQIGSGRLDQRAEQLAS